MIREVPLCRGRIFCSWCVCALKKRWQDLHHLLHGYCTYRMLTCLDPKIPPSPVRKSDRNHLGLFEQINHFVQVFLEKGLKERGEFSWRKALLLIFFFKNLSHICIGARRLRHVVLNVLLFVYIVYSVYCMQAFTSYKVDLKMHRKHSTKSLLLDVFISVPLVYIIICSTAVVKRRQYSTSKLFLLWSL